MSNLVDNLIKEIQSTNSPYVLKSTTITDGSRNGSVFIEIMRKTGFRFLDLHSEIRDQIYKLVLVKADPICLAVFRRGYPARVVTGTGFDNSQLHPGRVWDPTKHKWTGEPPNELSLLQVNKQIHAETTPIVYSKNRFFQGSSTALIHFAPMIGSSINFLTVVDFGEDCTRDNLKKLFTALHPATGLRKLRISHCVVFGRHAPHDRQSSLFCAERLAKDLKALLLCLQDSYKKQGRVWKALDVVRIRAGHWADGDMALLLRKKAKTYQALLRGLTNAYLKEE